MMKYYRNQTLNDPCHRNHFLSVDKIKGTKKIWHFTNTVLSRRFLVSFRKGQYFWDTYSQPFPFYMVSLSYLSNTGTAKATPHITLTPQANEALLAEYVTRIQSDHIIVFYNHSQSFTNNVIYNHS